MAVNCICLAKLIFCFDCAEKLEEAAQRMPKVYQRNKGSSGSLFSRAINSLISIEYDENDSNFSQAEGDTLLNLARRSAEACSVERIINDSKFLVRFPFGLDFYLYPVLSSKQFDPNSAQLLEGC